MLGVPAHARTGWLLPTLEYHDDVADGPSGGSDSTVSRTCSQWYRFWLFWRYAGG